MPASPAMLGAQRNIATRCQPALAPLTGGCARPVRQCVRPATLTPRPSALSLAAPVPKAPAGLGLPLQTALAGLRTPLLSKPAEAARPDVRAEASTSGVPAAEPKKFMGIEAMTWIKITALGFMFFCILFNYTILRDSKDVLVVTAPGSGAEVIPFLKTYVNLPMAIGFSIIYAKLANVLSNEALFYVCIIPFIAFFGSFAFIMYPLRDQLHPTAFCERLLEKYGTRLMGPIAILRNWTFCLFYVMAELWGSVVVSLLFWGFANQIVTVDEAKTFYPLFGLGANVALIFSGRAVKYFSQVRAKLPPGVDGWGYSLKGMMGMVVTGGVLITATYFLLQRTVVAKVQAGQPKKKKAKSNMGLKESFDFLARSPYIRDLATLVVAYGISINLVEVTWKGKIKAQFPNPNDYSAFMGDFSSCTGAVTFIMMIASRFIFRKFGWGVAAQITPIVLLITGVGFFGLVLAGGALSAPLAKLGTTPLMAAVLIGAAQNVFSKSAKYSLFDPCKEMAYIPLDRETQLKGKAAIDVVCNPLGKSGGSAIQQVMIITFGSLASSTPYLGIILLGIVLLWLRAARSLDGQFSDLNKKEQLAKLAEARTAASLPGKNKYKFVSAVNEQGFIEGKYMPLEPGEDVTASMDVVSADTPELAAALAAAKKEFELPKP